MVDNRVISKLNAEGKLGRLGYHVNSAPIPLSDIQRQRILTDAIKNELMTVKEIEISLQMLININANKYESKQAVVKWKRDLKYIKELYDDGAKQMNIFDCDNG